MLRKPKHRERLQADESDGNKVYLAGSQVVPAHIQILEDLLQKFELDPEIARDLGDAFLTARDLGNVLLSARDLGEALLKELEKGRVADASLIERDLGNALLSARDLGDSLLKELEKGQVAADKQASQLVS
jgi:hypothetical protein